MNSPRQRQMYADLILKPKGDFPYHVKHGIKCDRVRIAVTDSNGRAVKFEADVVGSGVVAVKVNAGLAAVLVSVEEMFDDEQN